MSEKSQNETAELPSFFSKDYIVGIKKEHGEIENVYSSENSSKNFDYPDQSLNSKTPWFRHSYHLIFIDFDFDILFCLYIHLKTST